MGFSRLAGGAGNAGNSRIADAPRQMLHEENARSERIRAAAGCRNRLREDVAMIGVTHLRTVVTLLVVGRLGLP